MRSVNILSDRIFSSLQPEFSLRIQKPQGALLPRYFIMGQVSLSEVAQNSALADSQRRGNLILRIALGRQRARSLRACLMCARLPTLVGTTSLCRCNASLLALLDVTVLNFRQTQQ